MPFAKASLRESVYRIPAYTAIRRVQRNPRMAPSSRLLCDTIQPRDDVLSITERVGKQDPGSQPMLVTVFSVGVREEFIRPIIYVIPISVQVDRARPVIRIRREA